jgi:hypothetical protein
MVARNVAWTVIDVMVKSRADVRKVSVGLMVGDPMCELRRQDVGCDQVVDAGAGLVSRLDGST